MRLRDVALVGPGTRGFNTNGGAQTISFLPLNSIWSDSRFDPTQEVEFNGEIESYNPVLEGDVLVPKVSPTFAHRRVAVAHGLVGGMALATSEVFVVRPENAEDARFLKYRLLASDVVDEGVASWTGVGGLKRVSSEFLKNVGIQRIAWDNRKRIGERLEAEARRIDQERSAAARALAALGEQRISIVQECLDSEQDGSEQQLRFAVRINPEQLSEDTPLDYEFEYIDIGSVDRTVGIVGSERNAFASAPSRARRVVRAGDVIVSTVRTYLVSVAEVGDDYDGEICSTGFAVLRPPPDVVDSRFLRYLVSSKRFVDEVTARSVGVSYPGISPSALGRIQVLIPPLERQLQIVRALETRLAPIDRAVRAVERVQEEANCYLRALITESVNATEEGS